MAKHPFVQSFEKNTQGYDTFTVGKSLGFSWWECDTCGGPSGARHEINLHDTEHGGSVTTASCVGCVLYVTNGIIPE